MFCRDPRCLDSLPQSIPVEFTLQMCAIVLRICRSIVWALTMFHECLQSRVSKHQAFDQDSALIWDCVCLSAIWHCFLQDAVTETSQNYIVKYTGKNEHSSGGNIPSQLTWLENNEDFLYIGIFWNQPEPSRFPMGKIEVKRAREAGRLGRKSRRRVERTNVVDFWSFRGEFQRCRDI